MERITFPFPNKFYIYFTRKGGKMSITYLCFQLYDYQAIKRWFNEYMICLSYETEGAKFFHTVYIMMVQNVTNLLPTLNLL